MSAASVTVAFLFVAAFAQAPVQPAKVEFAPAVAVSVTIVPATNLSEQVEPQLMPAGLEVTVPLPVPVLVTVSVCASSKSAVQVRSWSATTEARVRVPEQSPPQPTKIEPAVGEALRVTVRPSSIWALQVAPQSMP